MAGQGGDRSGNKLECREGRDQSPPGGTPDPPCPPLQRPQPAGRSGLPRPRLARSRAALSAPPGALRKVRVPWTLQKGHRGEDTPPLSGPPVPRLLGLLAPRQLRRRCSPEQRAGESAGAAREELMEFKVGGRGGRKAGGGGGVGNCFQSYLR